MSSSGLLKSTAIYALSDGLGKAINFFILPIISRFLVPEQMGIVANFTVLQSIVNLLAGQAIVNALPFFYYERSKKEFASLISSLLLLIIIINLVLSITLLLFNEVIDQFLYLSLGLQLFTIVVVIGNLITSTSLVLYRLEEKPYSFATMQLLYIVLYVMVMYYMVVVCKMEAFGKIMSLGIGVSVVGIIHLISLYRRGYLTTNVSFDTSKTLLKFGVPLLPHSLSFWLKGGMDKIFLTSYCGLAANGIYSMAMSFGAVYTIFNNAFFNTYTPYLQKRINSIKIENKNTENRKIVKMSYLLCLVFIAVSLIAIGFSWLAIEYLLDRKYLPSLSYLPWIIGSLTINSFYSVFIQFPYTKKKTGGLGIITFACSLIHMFLTFTFIKYLGEDGIKYSLVIGSLMTMTGVWWFSNRTYPLPWFSFMKSKKK